MATMNENVKGSGANVMDDIATTTISLSPTPAPTSTAVTTTTITTHSNSINNNDDDDDDDNNNNNNNNNNTNTNNINNNNNDNNNNNNNNNNTNSSSSSSNTDNNLVTAKNSATEYSAPATSTSSSNEYLVQPRIQPMIEYYYENQGYSNQPNCFMFSTMSYPFLPNLSVAPSSGIQKQESWYYQFINNIQGYRWVVPREPSYFPNTSTAHVHANKEAGGGGVGGGPVKYESDAKHATPSYWCKGDSSSRRLQSVKCNRQKAVSSKMHPVQLLHQIFRKEAFVMEYERINDGPFSQVRVTYKVNGKSYTAEATRLKEARRLCAKLVLRDQFPDLCIELDSDIPQPEYDAAEFDNKHPVQILYQIFRYEPMEMQCEEEGAAHFAKHIFTFSIRGNKYQAKAETIKEAKRRAAILVLNDYFKKKNND